MNKLETSATQLVSEQDANDFLIKNRENRLANQATAIEPTIKLRTWIFIQSLKFISSLEINLTGYIWQRYKNAIRDAIKPDQSKAIFILPEQANTAMILNLTKFTTFVMATEKQSAGILRQHYDNPF